jgi:hypothetical protein
MLDTDQNVKEHTSSSPAVRTARAPAGPPPRTTQYFSAALMLVAITTVVSSSFYLWYDEKPQPSRELTDGEEEGLPPESGAPQAYTNWQQPLLALVLSGQMHGYIDPCGCSKPQFGGLERRYNFIDSLRKGTAKRKPWDVVGIDLGELPKLQGIHEQTLLKYALSMRALEVMGYQAVGIGKNEILMPLGEGLAAAWDKKDPTLRPLSLSLARCAPGGQYHALNARQYQIVQNTRPKLGIISMMGPEMRELYKNQENFLNNAAELPRALDAFAQAGVEIGIILHHEHPDVDPQIQGIQRMQIVEKQRMQVALTCAKFCANERMKNPRIPPIQLMMILTDEPEPPALLVQPDPALPTQVAVIGHKGKYVGLVGLYRSNDKKEPFRMQYQIVEMSEEWETPEGKKGTQPVVLLVEKYKQELRAQKMMDKLVRNLHPNQVPPVNQAGLKATYVGSGRCGECHPAAYKVWEGTRHAIATNTLEDKKKRPVGHQYDPECMMCHTTGFKHPSGYNDLVNAAIWPAKNPDPVPVAKLEKHNAKLRGVGCESCHGPASEHEKNPDNAALYKIINPFRPTAAELKLEDAVAKGIANPAMKNQLKILLDKRLRPIGNFCTSCHDHENDVNWGGKGHDTIDMWYKVIHRTPRAVLANPPQEGVEPPAALKIEVQKTGVPLIPEIRIEDDTEKKK